MSLKGALESSRVKKQERQKIYRNATRNGAKPYSLEKIQSLQVNGLIPIEVFYEHIGGIWPFIVSAISEGMKLQAIERLIGVKQRTLQTLFARIPKLKETINRAKDIRSDDRSLSGMME